MNPPRGAKQSPLKWDCWMKRNGRANGSGRGTIFPVINRPPPLSSANSLSLRFPECGVRGSISAASDFLPPPSTEGRFPTPCSSREKASLSAAFIMPCTTWGLCCSLDAMCCALCLATASMRTLPSTPLCASAAASGAKKAGIRSMIRFICATASAATKSCSPSWS